MTDALAQRWLRDCAALPARGEVAQVGARVLSAYGAPTRGYHDGRHLGEVLDAIDRLAYDGRSGCSPAGLAAVRIAAWFHDVVYEAAPDDERRSAEVARSALESLDVDPPAVAEVVRLVLLTATHDPAVTDPAGALLCDADLAVLASDPERYAEYAAGVRHEYAHYDAAGFAHGRATVLERLLARPAIYTTPAARAAWEQPARANLHTELLLLGSGSGTAPQS